MVRLIFTNQLNAGLTALFIFVMVSILCFSVRSALQAWRQDKPSDSEMPYQALKKGKIA